MGESTFATSFDKAADVNECCGGQERRKVQDICREIVQRQESSVNESRRFLASLGIVNVK
jgi:hypothetical protein